MTPGEIIVALRAVPSAIQRERMAKFAANFWVRWYNGSESHLRTTSRVAGMSSVTYPVSGYDQR